MRKNIASIVIFFIGRNAWDNFRKFLRKFCSTLYFKRLEFKNYKKTSEEIFTRYWKTNHWKQKESKSGEGSSLAYTQEIRKNLPLLLDKYQIKSILDAPCGDFYWFQHVNLKSDIIYYGADIVIDMINENNKLYGRENRVFVQIDLLADNLPSIDIWICRDLIFHLPEKDIIKLISKFIDSNINYLLITSHTEKNIKNKDTFLGGCRLTNLNSHPYDLPESIDKIKDYIDGFPERYMLLYDKDTLINWRTKKLSES